MSGDVLLFLGSIALAVVLGIRIGLRCALAARDLDRHTADALALIDADRHAETICDAADLAETGDEKRWTL